MVSLDLDKGCALSSISNQHIRLQLAPFMIDRLAAQRAIAGADVLGHFQDRQQIFLFVVSVQSSIF